jgi:hypothetical protein
MKKILGILILGLTLLVGCTPVEYAPIAPVVVAPVTTQPPKAANPISSEYGDIDITHVAVGSFGVYGSLLINNYQTGVTVDKNIKGYQPLYIINRVNKVSEKKVITTDKGEVMADIPIRRLLHDEDITSVINVTSDLLGDTLKAEKYNSDGTLTISGFTPDATRNATITYVPDSEYSVSCTTSTTNEAGYTQAPPEVVKWVTFDTDRILIAPDSYAPVWVNLTVPEGTKLPDKWEFYVVISLYSGKQTSGIGAAIEYNVGIKVDMG